MLLSAVMNDIWTRLCIAAVAIGKGLAHTHSFKFYIQHSKQSIRKQQCSHTNKKKGKFERKRINEENNAVSFYVMFPLLWRDWSLCYFNAQLPFSKSTWTNIQGQRCRSGRCSFLQQGSPEILILLIQCLLRWAIGNTSVSNFGTSSVPPKQGGRQHLSGTRGQPISSLLRIQPGQGTLLKELQKLSYPNSQAEVCFSFLNFAFEGKLEGDFQLLYCLNDPDRVFKHICSAEQWTGFFGEKELCRALRPIIRHLLSFLNSEKSCNVKKNWSQRSKEKGRQLTDCF